MVTLDSFRTLSPHAPRGSRTLSSENGLSTQSFQEGIFNCHFDVGLAFRSDYVHSSLPLTFRTPFRLLTPTRKRLDLLPPTPTSYLSLLFYLDLSIRPRSPTCENIRCPISTTTEQDIPRLRLLSPPFNGTTNLPS